MKDSVLILKPGELTQDAIEKIKFDSSQPANFFASSEPNLSRSTIYRNNAKAMKKHQPTVFPK